MKNSLKTGRFLFLILALVLVPALGRPLAKDDGGGKLSPGEIKALAKKLSKYTSLLMKYQNEKKAEKRLKLDKQKKKAFEGFLKAIKKLENKKKFKFLKSMKDLKAVLSASFNYKKMKTRPGDFFSGQIKEKIGKRKYRIYNFGYWLPKSYSSKWKSKAFPLIISLPVRRTDTPNWNKGSLHLKNLYAGSPLLDEFILFCPELPKDMDYSGTPENADDLWDKWLAPLLYPLNEFLNSHHVDWKRIYLEAGRESTRLAIFFASVAPRYFAGLILRDPQPMEGAVVRNFHSLPTLFMVTKESKKNTEWFLKIIKYLKYDNCTVLEGKSFPFPELNQKYVEWIKKHVRNPAPSHIVFQPLFSDLRSSWWVRINKYGKFVEDAKTEKELPIIEITADKKENKIVAKCQNISSYDLMINDDIVDLDRPITVITNGKAREFKVERDINQAIMPAINNDPEFIVTYTLFGIEVPKEQESKETPGDKGAGGGK